MGSKKFLYMLVIFCIVHVLNCPLLLAQPEVCTFSVSGIEGVEVGQIGNRQIYTLFTPVLMDEAKEIFSIDNSYNSLLDAVGPLNQLIDWHQPIIKSEQSDAEKIIELAESGRIDWVGIEYPRTETTYVDNIREGYLLYRNRINTELNPSSEWDSSKTDQLLALVFEAYTIVNANKTKFFRNVEIYPLEIDTVNEQHNLFGYFNYWEGLIEEDPFVTEGQHLGVTSFIEETMRFGPRLITEAEVEILLDRLEVLEEARFNIRILIKVHNDIASLYLQSDRAVTQSILDLSGNGLLLFETGRSFGIKQGLISACQNGNSRV